MIRGTTEWKPKPHPKLKSQSRPVRCAASPPGWWRTPHGTPHSKADGKSSDSSPARLIKPFLEAGTSGTPENFLGIKIWPILGFDTCWWNIQGFCCGINSLVSGSASLGRHFDCLATVLTSMSGAMLPMLHPSLLQLQLNQLFASRHFSTVLSNIYP